MKAEDIDIQKVKESVNLKRFSSWVGAKLETVPPTIKPVTRTRRPTGLGTCESIIF